MKCKLIGILVVFAMAAFITSCGGGNGSTNGNNNNGTITTSQSTTNKVMNVVTHTMDSAMSSMGDGYAKTAKALSVFKFTDDCGYDTGINSCNITCQFEIPTSDTPTTLSITCTDGNEGTAVITFNSIADIANATLALKMTYNNFECESKINGTINMTATYNAELMEDSELNNPDAMACKYCVSQNEEALCPGNEQDSFALFCENTSDTCNDASAAVKGTMTIGSDGLTVKLPQCDPSTYTLGANTQMKFTMCGMNTVVNCTQRNTDDVCVEATCENETTTYSNVSGTFNGESLSEEGTYKCVIPTDLSSY